MHASIQTPEVTPKVPTINVLLGDGRAQTLQIPRNHEEMLALLAQRKQLKEQLEQATGRRNDVMNKMFGVPDAAKQSLQTELSVLNDQIVQLDGSLNVVGREIAQSSPALIAMAEQETNSDEPGTFEDGAFLGAGGMFLGLTTLLLLGRWIWKRFIRDDTPAPRILPPADSERLKRLENGMEAMAVEIERISEGQRYVTKLLSESRGVESPR